MTQALVCGTLVCLWLSWLTVRYIGHCVGPNVLDTRIDIGNIVYVGMTTDTKNDNIIGLRDVWGEHKDAIEINESNDKTFYDEFFEIECFDVHKDCFKWSREGECDTNPGYMLKNCAKSCNTCYNQSMEFRFDNCENTYSTTYEEDETNCYIWKNEGYCKNNTFMKRHCKKACNYCSFDSRCEPHLEHQSALNLNNYTQPNLYERLFFKRILMDKYLVSKYDIKLLTLDPPILYFGNFMPDMITNLFMYQHQNVTFKRSVIVLGNNDDGSAYMGETQERTSTNAWCDDECKSKYSTEILLHAMEEITGINKNYYEDLQMLTYTKYGYYHYHHDFIESQTNSLAGGRILTFFIYLNDVEIGGETNFPQLKLKVKPKKGSAILWPNVVSNDMNKQDERTHHAALPVIKGVKYALNGWIHLFDYKYANDRDCT